MMWYFLNSLLQKRIMVYPNGESVERATYIWGDTLDQLLNNASLRLNLWQPAKRLFTMEGKEVTLLYSLNKEHGMHVNIQHKM